MAAQQHASSNGGTTIAETAEQPLQLLNTSAEARVVESPQLSTSERKLRLAEILVSKTAQGYRIESQTDTEATLTTKGPRRWFAWSAATPRPARSRRSTSRVARARALLNGVPQAMAPRRHVGGAALHLAVGTLACLLRSRGISSVPFASVSCRNGPVGGRCRPDKRSRKVRNRFVRRAYRGCAAGPRLCDPQHKFAAMLHGRIDLARRPPRLRELPLRLTPQA